MEIKVLSEEKNEIEIELKNVTLAEILRVYLNKDEGVDFAAWKRSHPSEKPALKVKTKSKEAKKVVKDAVAAITKDLDKFEKDFSKLK